MFGKLDDILSKAMKIDHEEAWFFVIDDEVKEEIIRLNTEDQLEEEGIDSLNRSLGDYSPFTVNIKRAKGQRTDHITLKDTGAFYNSFVVKADRTGFTIIADDTSIYDVPLTLTFGQDILGLTDENTRFLHDFLLENYTRYIEQEILR